MVIHIERLQREKANGATVSVGFDASKVVIVKLSLDKVNKERTAAGTSLILTRSTAASLGCFG